MGISQKNENIQWEKDHQPSTSSWSKKALGLGYSFPKQARFLSRRDYARRPKDRFVGLLLHIEFSLDSKSIERPRLGISVSKRYGDAVKRNRFKRCVREAFRLEQQGMPKGLRLHISAKNSSIPPSLQNCLHDISGFLTQLRNT